MSSKTTTQAAGLLVETLEPFSSEDRMKCIRAAMVLLGEDGGLPLGKTESHAEHRQAPVVNGRLGEPTIGGEKLRRWMVQHQVTEDQLNQIYHINGTVELIADAVPGRSKKDKTINCYLLVGVRALIQNDEPKFADKEAMEFCQITLAYDKNNHTANRQALSNRASGDRVSGFTLTVPGLRDAANLIKEMGAAQDS